MTPTKAGRYELTEELGRGAMGIVYKAFDPMIRRTVAVKTMRLTEEGSGMPRPEMIARFQTEARAAGVLTHPNIVTVFDAGEDQGLFYITMEFVEGRSLQSLMDQKQVFPLPRIMRIMEQACSALDFAHKHSIVHRDIKPANMMLSAEDLIKVTDFGTAKILQISTTQTGNIIGTPSYMSPEQVKGKLVDGRSDIFSLGVVLYELVTGEKPFPGQNVTTVIYKIVNEDPIPPRELDSSIHPGLSAVITKSLTKDPDGRYQSCQQLLEDLKNYRTLGTAEDPYGATLVMVGRPRLPDLPAASPPAAPPAQTGHVSTGTLFGTGPVAPLPSPHTTQRPPTPSRAAVPRPPVSYAEEEVEEAPKKRGGMVWLALFLLVLLAGGSYVLWPNLQELLNRGRPPAGSIATSPTTTSAPPTAGAEAGAAPDTEPKPVEKPPAETATSASPPATPPESKKEAGPAPTGAEQVKAKVEQRLAQAGFLDKVRVEVSGNEVTLRGTLTPPEHRRLRERFRGAPAGVRVRDRIQLARAGAGEAAPPRVAAEPEEKPKTSPGLGEVEVIPDVSGAKAVLTGPNGSKQECRSPCRFEDLPPGRYTMEVTHDGYRPERRILQVRGGHITTPDIKMQEYASGIYVVSRPARAEVLINGQRHDELTPTTIRLAPGSYNIVVQKSGYESHQGTVRLSGEELQRLEVDLPASQRRARAMGWVEVRTIPRGADIVVDGIDSGQKTPSRLELPAGEHTLTLYLKGYLAIREQITVEEGQTIQVNKALPRP